MVRDPGKTCNCGVADVWSSGATSFYSDKMTNPALERYTFILAIGVVFSAVKAMPVVLSGIEMTVA